MRERDGEEGVEERKYACEREREGKREREIATSVYEREDECVCEREREVEGEARESEKSGHLQRSDWDVTLLGATTVHRAANTDISTDVCGVCGNEM